MNLTTSTPIKVALTGDVALEVLASYFQDAGYEVMPQTSDLVSFAPDFVYDVTSAEHDLAREVADFYDARLEKLSGCRFSRAGIRAIVEEFGWLVSSRQSTTVKKILAVDADNTLWKGILSEDGKEALRPCKVFQAGLEELRERGVVLVLLSKNDPFELPLFTRCKVNWAPKAGNLLEVCHDLNLATDSVVFLDDNPHERAQMKAHLPEVTVAPWFGWPETSEDVSEALQRQLVRRLTTYFFASLGQTEEDRLRAADYAAARERLSRAFRSQADYLNDLQLWVKPSLAASADLPRLVQMAGKTNQFNATTLRRTRDEFATLLSDPQKRVFVFRAGDRFGEQGLVCYVVVDLSTRRATDFVMSCRAMGRTLEHFAYTYVSRTLGFCPAVDFVPTAKNRPFAEFHATLGGELTTYFKEIKHEED